MREKQRAPRLDVPIQIADAARLLASDKATVDDSSTRRRSSRRSRPTCRNGRARKKPDNVPSGVAPPGSYHETLRKAADDLNKAAKSKDVKRAARVAESLLEISDDLLARNLLSLAYGISLGDPEGTVLLADDVSHRHDFGFGLKDAEVRSRLSWAMPRQEVTPGVALARLRFAARPRRGAGDAVAAGASPPTGCSRRRS